MNWLKKIFNQKKELERSPEEQIQLKRKWDSYDYFEKGIDYFRNGNNEDALVHFENSLKYGFEEFFTNEASKLYDLKAASLQGLGYDYDALIDFDKSISLEPNDCNNYFSRSISKGAILDFEGEIADLEKAIQLSKIDNALNREYNDEAQKQGYSGAAGMFEMRLVMAKMKLDSDMKNRELVENAKTPNDKEKWEIFYKEQKERKLSQIKRRNP